MLLLIPIFNFLVSWIMIVLIKEGKIVKGARLARWVNWGMIGELALICIFYTLVFILCLLPDPIGGLLGNFGRGEVILIAFSHALLGVSVLIFNVIVWAINHRKK